MKQLAALALAVSAMTPVFAGTNAGVSIGINQPGVYGRIDIGNYPAPAIVSPQPVVIVVVKTSSFREAGRLARRSVQTGWITPPNAAMPW